ncbi:hypothetical protein FKG94_16125 [Exilibacterium tricleocarpae]|uniref:Uncharacterized protein n=1 Tax=Exilibacterium tricleocarpae TaxID=2591008 RepID=A0A545TBF1_9GAMM|nr:hypothetical protein [Exilibacterium tricleocarpae]TQV74538.1 hypothetical protein FKG94_16125 [Exilibacterium tricleocarpae]
MKSAFTMTAPVSVAIALAWFNQSAVAAPNALQELESACGVDRTLAVVRTERDDRYIFCAGEDTVNVIELQRDDGESRSRLTRFESADKLFFQLVPSAVDIPMSVLASLRLEGTAPAQPWVLDMADDSTLRQSAGKGKVAASGGAAFASCAAPSLGLDVKEEFFNDYTFCDHVAVGSAYSNLPSWHASGASFLHALGQLSPSHAGPHEPWKQWFADEDEEGDARFARARVRSCGGTTRLRTWHKASATTGSWNKVGDIDIPSGWIGTQQLFGNPQHSLWMGYDHDDFWFRSDPYAGASIGSLHYYAKYAWGVNCDLIQ